ncbi:ankyrin repeat domain-containing protein 10-like isoform X2 [Saccostrea echinata]|uniref:ankyrin repeat domain-containing protein 10-like isoform X2 n=1 Tax=Saccostrea echinata TaxID=191078 RepID=UPI002A7EEADE|nr:ankyrin repeat domain-containing protein 10-like isoform X2 [Saccostrea echinata]
MAHQNEVQTWSLSAEELFQRHFPLHQACRNGDLEKLSILLSGGNAEFYEEDSFYGWSPLHWAANFGKLTCLIRLVQNGANCDVPTERTNITPSHVAAESGKGHCLSWLLQNHALINRQDYLGDTPTHKAAKKGHMECVSLLVSQGASLCLLNHSHCTPSQAAAENGHLECAQYIENAAKLQGQGQLPKTHCVTMQPSHLLHGQMEHIVTDMAYQNGHFSDGPCPIDNGMDMSGDGPMVGMKRGRDEFCEEDSFKRMRKGDVVSLQNSGISDTPLVNNNSYFPSMTGSSVEEHEKTVWAQQGYDSLFIHSVISEFHGS